MIKDDDEPLIEAVASAHRARDPITGAVLSHPSHADLDAEGRVAAFAASVLNRRIEAALDPDGLSSTVRAVLGRIR